ncbi:MAG: molecular chaperone HtpG [Thermomicrobiales bacterium]
MTSETVPATPGPVPFRAEVKQLLQILAHSLYTDRETFLRELISNASDARHRVQFEMLTNHDIFDAEAELAIHITVDEAEKTITIADSGIGMTAEELAEHLGTIAHSGVRTLLEQLEASQRGGLIGQFGVGFYSAFVVADEVTVISRSYQPEAQAARWHSRGDETFTIEPAEREHRGTSVILKLKEDAAEFAAPWRLRQIVKRHSDFVAFPIYVGDERANQQTALWRESPHQVEAGDAAKYDEFYRELTLDAAPPLLHVHVSADAPLDLHALLFVPAKLEHGVLERRTEGTIRLYSRKVLIQEAASDLLPAYYRFVEGVVDSEDLPLNVARETVQSSPILQRIRRTLTGRLTKALAELAEEDAEKYATFWQEFGVFLKEGIAADPTARDALLPLLRFHSTKSDTLISLADYKSRVAAGQTEIYYVLAGDLESARRSPHLEALAERDLEALLLPDVVDAFMLSGLHEFEGLPLRNADDPNLVLPGQASAAAGDAADEAFGRLAARAREVLGERVRDVRPSTMLRASPARLVSPEAGPERELARLQRLFDRDYTIPPKYLELHPGHPLIADLARLVDEHPDDALIAPLIEQLYDSALLLEGLHPNPAGMVERIELLMEAAARGTR